MTRLTIKTLALIGLVLAASIGMANAGTMYNDVVHDALTGTVVHNTWGNCVVTKWMVGRNNCGVTISEEARTVYFAFNSAALTREAHMKLDTLARALRAGGIQQVQVAGYADRMGNPVYNEKLSKKRAEAVRHYLVAHGIAQADVIKTRWLGESEPTTNCPADLKRKDLIACLQPDRRVEVELVYK
jgi:outer membrane protein OmpA-like peptidoglycan-associated protein